MGQRHTPNRSENRPVIYLFKTDQSPVIYLSHSSVNTMEVMPSIDEYPDDGSVTDVAGSPSQVKVPSSKLQPTGGSSS